MENNVFQHIASQLRKPEGEMGKQVGVKMNTGNALIYKWTIELLNVQPHDNILEIGMGNGGFVKDICRGDVSVRYTGVDYSPTMIEEATKINEELITNNQAHFLLGNAQELPFMSHSFNKVFTVNTIYFWEDNIKVLTEIKRALKPEGMLVVAVRPKSVMSNYPYTQYGFRMFSKEELTDLLNKNGFTVTNVLERAEPEQEVNGKMVKTASLILVSRKEIQKEQGR
jgi:ubiquinone/menaquinone biosynthesis C-methylase UbiE